MESPMAKGRMGGEGRLEIMGPLAVVTMVQLGDDGGRDVVVAVNLSSWLACFPSFIHS